MTNEEKPMLLKEVYEMIKQKPSVEYEGNTCEVIAYHITAMGAMVVFKLQKNILKARWIVLSPYQQKQPEVYNQNIMLDKRFDQYQEILDRIRDYKGYVNEDRLAELDAEQSPIIMKTSE